MISRKAITTAFETIIPDRKMKSITVFCSAKNIPLMKTSRVRVTRMAKSPDDYRVTLGRMNYQERAFIKRERFAERKALPKVLMSWQPTKKTAKKP